MQIAYITYQNLGKYTSSVADEDEILLSFLTKKGLKIKEEIWTDEQVIWGNYTHLLIKSPWDYFDKYEQWTQWLNHIKLLNLIVINPIITIQWNSDKHYLKEIESAGLKTTPTQFIEKGTFSDLTTFFTIFASAALVVKPSVSGGSKNTMRFNAENVIEIQELLNGFLKEEAYMVQPFIEEITNDGEWSFLFFNGKYSHSLIKKAKAGDFRVQHYLGGTIHPQTPSKQQIEAIQPYVDQFAKGCLYARVDGFYRNGEFYLMELELIEPFLFLFTAPQSYENYYQALNQMLTSSFSFSSDLAHN
ncbi:MAG: hypothetical protein ABIP95_01535 [Pelobium sp.]